MLELLDPTASWVAKIIAIIRATPPEEFYLVSLKVKKYFL